MAAAVRAVFFDLDDTLVLTSKHDRRAYEAVQEKVAANVQGVDTDALVAAFKADFGQTPWDPAYPAEKTSVFDHRASIWAAALKEQMKKGCAAMDDAAIYELGKELQTCFDETRMADFPFDDGAADVVRKLQAKNVRTVVITNGHHVVQHAKLIACKATDLFDPNDIIVGGDEVVAGRKEKPDKGIFEKACTIAGVAPGEAVHVGDSLKTDVQGAINAQLGGSVWVNASGKARKDTDPVPTATIVAIKELESALASTFGLTL